MSEEIGRRALQSGDYAGAREAFEQVVAGRPNDAGALMSLAVALRGLDRPEEERAALDRLLAIEPRHFRGLLQAASLYEKMGDLRSAGAVYRTALQSIPRGSEPPADVRPVLDHALKVVEANDRALEGYLAERLEGLRAGHAGERLDRFDKCVDTLLRKRRVYRPSPSFLYFPQLPAIEFYDRADFPWLDPIEAATEDIREELLAILADGEEALTPYVSLSGTPVRQWQALNNSKRWGVNYLWRAGTPVRENLDRCPRTVAALEAWPRCELEGTAPTAVFSILDARTRIPPHSGVNNARLIVHVPLIVPPGCGFRVGAETREWIPGKAFVFDDTIEHEAWNDSAEPRAVLIIDTWNPFLSQAEREMVTALTAGVGDFYGQLPPYITGAPA